MPLGYDILIFGHMESSAHILIVDDHREIRDLVGQILAKDGYRVSTAGDGREMRQALRDRKIDLIVLDLMLPVDDGLALCRELRAGSSTVPIIILTAKGDEIDRVLGLEMGADDYVAKPFSGRELLARGGRALCRRRRKDRRRRSTVSADGRSIRRGARSRPTTWSCRSAPANTIS
jgi:two-component system OmpR family response regulator